MPLVRVFIAIRLSEEILTALAQVQERLRRSDGGPAGRWVKPEGIHLTLKFLGEVPTERLEVIYEAVRRACQGVKPFSLVVAELGCFPNMRQPRVVWAGVQEETGHLAGLQRAIERELERQGFPREERGFKPHLTLARVNQAATRSEAERLGRSVGGTPVGVLGQMRANQVSVMRSDLRPDGALYTELLGVPLGEEPVDGQQTA